MASFHIICTENAILMPGISLDKEQDEAMPFKITSVI